MGEIGEGEIWRGGGDRGRGRYGGGEICGIWGGEEGEMGEGEV